MTLPKTLEELKIELEVRREDWTDVPRPVEYRVFKWIMARLLAALTDQYLDWLRLVTGRLRIVAIQHPDWLHAERVEAVADAMGLTVEEVASALVEADQLLLDEWAS